MKFLIDADLPKSFKNVFSKYKYETIDVREALGAATDDEIFNYANKNKLILLQET